MKKVFLAMLVAVGLHVAPVQAQINDQFDVNITLVPSCTLTTAPGDISVIYTSGAAGTATGTTNFQVTCTNGAPYTFTLANVANGALTSTGPGAVSITVPDATLSLNYSVSILSGGVGVGSGTGSGAAQTYTLEAAVAGPQAGSCPNVACDNSGSGNKTQQLTIAY